MSKNAQILLENLIEQEFRNNDNYSNISEYFEFFSASQILKNQGLSDDEVDNGIVGKGLDGGCDSIYLFLNNLLITPDVVEHIFAPKDSILEMIIIQSKKTTSFGEDAVMKWKPSLEIFWIYQKQQLILRQGIMPIFSKHLLRLGIHIHV